MFDFVFQVLSNSCSLIKQFNGYPFSIALEIVSWVYRCPNFVYLGYDFKFIFSSLFLLKNNTLIIKALIIVTILISEQIFTHLLEFFNPRINRIMLETDNANTPLNTCA